MIGIPQLDVLQSANQMNSATAYNAQLIYVRRCHADLMVIRVQPDGGIGRFRPGQYTTLGLGTWEPRCEDVQFEPIAEEPRLIRRAYSVSSPLLDAKGSLVQPTTLPWYEFYVSLVRQSPKRPPALTPRLFCKREGDRIFCGLHAHGRYTTESVKPDDAVFLLATGSGEAPHNAIIAELLANKHRGPIVSVTCVRYRKDLAYLTEHRALEKLFPQYRYLALTTREPENIDATHHAHVGRRYLQDYFATGALEHDAGVSVTSTDTHVFLCGSPSMIGSSQERPPRGSHGPAAVSGMVELLEERGLRVDLPHRPGTIHFETYW